MTYQDELLTLATMAPADKAKYFHFVADQLGWEDSKNHYPILCSQLDKMLTTKAAIVSSLKKINRYA